MRLVEDTADRLLVVPATRRWWRPRTRSRLCSGHRWRDGRLRRTHARRRPGPAFRGSLCRNCRPAAAGCSSRWPATRAGAPAKVVAEGGALGDRLVSDTAEAAALWRIREDGAGLAARSLKTPAYSGWEDAAVPPDRLGAWLRDFDELLTEHGLDGVPYGHFGDGCVHVRIGFPFEPGQVGSAKVFRDFLTACALGCATTAARSPAARRRRASELLPLMYDTSRSDSSRRSRRSATRATCSTPATWSTRHHWTPTCGRCGLPAGLPLEAPARRWPAGRGVHRCTGVGKRVAASTTGVMFVVPRHPRREFHPRPLRVLQEAMDGSLAGSPTRRSPGARPRPPVRARPPCARGHGDVQVRAPHQKRRVGPPAAQPPRSAGSRRADRAAPCAAREPGDAARSGGQAGQGDRRHRPAALDPGLREEDAAEVGGEGSETPTSGLGDSQRPLFPANGHAAIRHLRAGLTAA